MSHRNQTNMLATVRGLSRQHPQVVCGASLRVDVDHAVHMDDRKEFP